MKEVSARYDWQADVIVEKGGRAHKHGGARTVEACFLIKDSTLSVKSEIPVDLTVVE